ncbi:hypothetical protein AVEN_209015-1 [Araneus ventricosus]|uniref:Uncharacterized protein n=1 Tax=Araneus ventricosus TaxID=182803 RepID=A0A4Y2T6B8_ARAVE|nr:hypothetical protein AVEN_34803-1 [Araneus ventricosus]GBN67906.1 hypothetical protein AVEN_174033-1 [Araneus ventricosus]GBN94675.1 hypothetical protein AVEN_129287-1 [Araneus ventricosus]GBN94685.1 hypothetical protein AVEN_209015-1 [Araneus ventricosus]
MMKREGEPMFVVREIVHHPDKSWTLNLSATPQRAGSKVFLSWNLDSRGRLGGRVDSSLGFDSRDRILKSGLSRDSVLVRAPTPVKPISQTLAE